MVSGRGWIALVLVIFARWNPLWIIFGACLFGGLGALQLNLQARGWANWQYLLAMFPFLVTILVLTFTSFRLKSNGEGVPKELGKPLPFSS
jgi:simple sugar transport system permease protein